MQGRSGFCVPPPAHCLLLGKAFLSHNPVILPNPMCCTLVLLLFSNALISWSEQLCDTKAWLSPVKLEKAELVLPKCTIPSFRRWRKQKAVQTHRVHKQLIPTAQIYQSALQGMLALQVIPFELEGFCFYLGKVCLKSPAAGPSHLLHSAKAAVFGMRLAGSGG